MRVVFRFVNKSAHLTDADVFDLAALETEELARFADAFGLAPATAYVKGREPQGLPGVFVDVLLQDGIDDPEAGAYHTETKDGVPGIVVDVSGALARGGSIFTAPSPSDDSVLKLVDHECKEADADLFVCTWVVDENHDIALALEACDMTQGPGLVYPGTLLPQNGGKVDALFANHILPRWGDYQAPTNGTVAFDMLGTIKAPMTCAPTGYETLRQISTNFSTKWGPSKSIAERRLANFEEAKARIDGDRTAPFVSYGPECDPRHRDKHRTSPRLRRRNMKTKRGG